MKIIKLFLVFYVGISNYLYAQIVPYNAGSISAGTGGCGVIGTNIWAVNNNPAMLTALIHPEIAVNHERVYYNSGLSFNGIAGVFQHKTGTWGGQLSQWGYSHFKFVQSGLSYGKKLSKVLQAGMRISYNSFSLGDSYYGRQNFLQVGIGAAIHLPNNITTGFYLQNFHRPGVLRSKDERDEPLIKIGVGYKPYAHTQLMAEVVQQANKRAIFQCGLEYNYKENFIFRTGLSSSAESGKIGFGFGYKRKKLKWNFAAQWHPQLGISPQTGLHYVFF